MEIMETNIDGFTIRVYGILISDNKILISDEFEAGKYFTKFPGGGLEFGEGTKDCLLREWKEELNLSIEILDHFYTSDFFQRSSFHKNKQVISIYYLVKPLEDLKVKIADHAFDFEKDVEGSQSFRWIALKDFTPHDVTFDIDKAVAKLIAEKFAK